MDQTTIVSAVARYGKFSLVFQGSRCLVLRKTRTEKIKDRKGEENKELKINERRSGQSRTCLIFCLLCQLQSSAEQNTRMAKGFSVTRDAG